MLTVAVTGGIGSGKTTVTDHIIAKGFTVIDADKMSREMTGPGGKAMPYILEHFGNEYINGDGSLNRAAMRDRVFRDPASMEVLRKGTTDVVIEDIRRITEEQRLAGAAVLFFDIPLLFETGREGDYDQVWVVAADRSIRAARVMARDNVPADLIDLIMDTQADDERKIAGADLVIYNNGTVEELLAEVDKALACFEKCTE